MQFGDPIVGGDTLIRSAIQSRNYTAGSAGWSIMANGSAEFNNLTIRGAEVTDSTSLYYNGTPATGNLVASISATAGTDPYGNTYLAGVNVYAVSNGQNVFANLNGGAVNMGLLNSPTTAAVIGYGTLTIGSNQYTASVVGSPVTGGNTGSLSLTSNGLYVLDAAGARPTNVYVSGVVLATDNAGNVLTTQTVSSYNTNWAGNTSYGSLGTVETLSYKLLPDGRVHVHGAFKTGSSAPTTNTVFMLPNGYYRTDRNQLFTWHARIAPNSNETIGSGTVQTNGSVAVSSTNSGSTSPLVANSTFWTDFVVDGPNVQ